MQLNPKDLIDFLREAISPAFAAEEMEKRLLAGGFSRLEETKLWTLEPEIGYYVRRADAIVAFRVPAKIEEATVYHIVLSHLDSPSLRIRLKDIAKCENVICAPTEMYGGAIIHTWADRPLGVAISGLDKMGQKILAKMDDAGVIPNVAMHLKRNENVMDIQHAQFMLDARALGGLLAAGDGFCDYVLYDATPATICGNLLNGPRLDNLLSAYASMHGLINGSDNSHFRIAYFADSEEIGSMTLGGAGSNFLPSVLERMNTALEMSAADYARRAAASFMLSVDAAHAYLPSHPECYDSSYSPMINGGIASKHNCQGRYASTQKGLMELSRLVELAVIKAPQEFRIRPELSCGSTIGPRTGAMLGMECCDIGIAMWAMHSIRETAGMEDIADMCRLLECF